MYIYLCALCVCVIHLFLLLLLLLFVTAVSYREKKKTRGGKWWGEEGTIWATILNSSIGSGRLFDFFFFFSLLYIFILFSLLFSSATRVRRKNTLSLCVYIKDALPTKRRWRVYIHKTIEPIKLSCAIVYNPAASRPFFFFFFSFLTCSFWCAYSYFFFFRQRLVFVQCRRFLVSSDALHQHPPSAGRSVFLLLLLNRRPDKSLDCRMYTSLVIRHRIVYRPRFWFRFHEYIQPEKNSNKIGRFLDSGSSHLESPKISCECEERLLRILFWPVRIASASTKKIVFSFSHRINRNTLEFPS